MFINLKRLINRLICLVRGHKWEEIFKGYTNYIKFSRCAKCGKTKEEVR